MMAQNKQKTMLHELLKQDQEPFHLKTYISQKRSMLKRQRISNILCRHACFLKLHSTSDVTKSPFMEHLSPANKSPCKSPNGAVFLHVPSRTASLLLEAALRIQKHQKPKHRSGPGKSPDGLGLFGSFLKKIKSKSRKRAIAENDLKKGNEQRVLRNDVDRLLISCEDDDFLNLERSASSSIGGSIAANDDSDFNFPESRFCVSPFVFSFRRSPLSSGGFTPELCSPVGSPRSHVVTQENENLRNSEKNLRGAEDEEKEQCSPVSVLDAPFEEEDDHEEEEEEEEDDYNPESSYENVQRAKQQLLQRLRRFEKLAELDPMELERKLLEASDEEYQVISGDNEPLTENRIVETFVNEEFNKSSHMRKMSPELNRLVLDLIVVEKCESAGNRELEFDTIDTMIALDFKREVGGWKNVSEEVAETGIEVEILIFDELLEDLSDEMC